MLARDTIRGAALAHRWILLQHFQDGSWDQGIVVTTSSTGYVTAYCHHPRSPPQCGGRFRFNDHDVAHSTSFHVPVRKH